MMKRRSVSLIAIPARVLLIPFVLFAGLTLAQQATAQEACGISPDEVGRLADFLVQLGKTEEAEERILDPRLHPAGTPLEVSPKELLDVKVQLEKTRRQIQDTKHQLLDLVIRMNQCCEKLRQRLCPPTTQTAEEQEIRKGCGISPDEVGHLADFLVQLGKTEEAAESILDPRLHPAGTPLEVSPKELLDFKVQLEKTRRQIQDTKHQLLDLFVKMNQCCEKLRQKLCPPTSFKRNEAVGLFAIIREDAQPKRFNTYGATVDYTRFLNPAIGITGDFNANFRTQNGADLSKISLLGGVTIIPFTGAKTTDKVTVSTHALLGVSHFSSTAGSVSSTDNAFTMKLGGAVDVNVNNKFFIRPIQFDYAPTFFGGNTQNNFQFGFGAGFRFGK